MKLEFPKASCSLFRSCNGISFRFGVTVEFVIIPMVLQIGETMVLQKAELEGEASSSPFWVFGSFTVLMGKHGFAEKLHLK